MAERSYPELHRYLIIPTTIGSEEDETLTAAEGAWLWGASGKKYIDACAQVSCANIGHNHPKFTKWMEGFYRWAHAHRLITTVMGTDFFYCNNFDIGEYKVEKKKIELSPVALAERLAPRIFGAENTLFGFHVTGTQAVNIALRFFRTVTQKPYFISFEKAFHGRDGEAREVSDSNPVHWNEAPRSGSVFFLPYPETDADFGRAVEKLNSIPLKKCAAMIYEPVQGEGGGMRIGRYLRDLEALLKKEGILSISDEVQTGLGRCGTWWGYQQIGCDPDALVIGKSLGSGHPVSAVGFRRDRYDYASFPTGKVSGTFSMYPIGMAAANFTMQIYEEEQIVEKAAALSPLFDKLLRQAIIPFDEHDTVSPYYTIDGIGLYRSIKPYTFDGKPDLKKRNLLFQRLRELGVWTAKASFSFPAIRLTPPLVANKEELKFISYIVKQAIRSV